MRTTLTLLLRRESQELNSQRNSFYIIFSIFMFIYQSKFYPNCKSCTNQSKYFAHNFSQFE